MAWAALLKGLATASAVSGQSQGMFPPLQNAITRSEYNVYPNLLPGTGELTALRRFGNLSKEEFLQLMRESGIEPAHATRIEEASQAMMSAIEYVALFKRKEITETVFLDRMGKIGFEPEEIQHVLKVTEYFPPPPDLIRMAVRDVWAANKQQLGLGSAPPAKFLEEAAKSGLSGQWAQLYWDAHWELPSMTMGFEMFHRGIIKDPDQLAALIQAHDYNPIWHDKLLQLSYNNLTRVDVRRMYDLGVLDAAGVTKAYKDLGYSPENADLLTRFVQKATSDETKGLTVSSILRSYKEGLINAGEARELLKSMDLTDATIDFQLALADHEAEAAKLQDLEKELLARFQLGTIDENGIRVRLAQENAPAAFIDQVVSRIARSSHLKVKLPSRSDLERWFEKDLIDESFYFEYMIKLGYDREVARLYMAEITNDQTNPKRKYLSMTIYMRWLKAGILTDVEFTTLGQEMSLSPDDIQRSIQEARQSASGDK